MKTIPILFRVLQLAPDARPYKIAGLVVVPVDNMLVYVRVDVPLDKQYIVNRTNEKADAILSDLGIEPDEHKDTPQPQADIILTPAGLAYIEDQLLARSDKPKPEQSTDNSDLRFEDEE